MNLAIIQARMASTRLPGKALLKIGKQALIHHVLARAEKISGIDKVILATSKNEENNELSTFVKNRGNDVFRGDEDDVIERFYLIAEKYDADNIIRLTGDNPLVDFSAMSFLLARHVEERNDYTCMTGVPCGALGDIFSFRALKESHHYADGKALSDHVDLYVLENMERFRVSNYIIDKDFSEYRWTVDDNADLDRMCRFAQLTNIKCTHFDEINTRQTLHLIKGESLEREMRPKKVSISRSNLYTAELVKKIPRRVSVPFDGIE